MTDDAASLLLFAGFMLVVEAMFTLHLVLGYRALERENRSLHARLVACEGRGRKSKAQ